MFKIGDLVILAARNNCRLYEIASIEDDRVKFKPCGDSGATNLNGYHISEIRYPTRTSRDPKDGEITIHGYGPLTTRFKLVQASTSIKKYLVWADTMRYRLDGKDHPMDVLET